MNDLVVLENVNAVEVFSGRGVDDLLKKITEEAKSIVCNVETARGRRDIAAMAHKVAKSKTYLDGLGKDLVSDWKTKSKAVDNERKKMRDHLDNLKAEVRQPLTDWEQAEEDRTAKHEANILDIVSTGDGAEQNWMEENLGSMLHYVESIKIGDSWEEYANNAAKAKDAAIIQVKEAIAKREKYDAEQAELAKLRAESEEREQKKHEEALRREGEEKAKREAEAKAKVETEEKERELKQSEIARQAAIREKETAQRKVIEIEEKAKTEAIEAKARAEREIEEAAQVERDRMEQERIAEEASAKKREADKQHRAKINNAVVDALVVAGLSEASAKKVVTAIAKGQVPHIRIAY